MYAVSLMRVSLEQPLPMFQNLWLRRLEMPLTSKVEELLSVTLVAILLDCLLQIFPLEQVYLSYKTASKPPPEKNPWEPTVLPMRYAMFQQLCGCMWCD